MSNDKFSPLVFSTNGDVSAESLLSLHGDNNGDPEKQDIVKNIDFELIFPSIKNNFFHQCMVDFSIY